jgi:hypothetical protein
MMVMDPKTPPSTGIDIPIIIPEPILGKTVGWTKLMPDAGRVGLTVG